MSIIESTILTRSRVLIVDPSRTVREALRKRLGNRFDLREESDGEAAWQALVIDPSIQAVVTAVSLPRLDGYGLLQRVRSSNISRIQNMQIVMMSAEDTGTARAVAKSLGAADFFAKATGSDELTARLEVLINPSRVPRELTETNLFAGRPTPVDPTSQPVKPEDPEPRSSNKEQETHMSRLDSLNKVLKNLQSESPGVEASALISEDGLMIASALPQDLDETRVGGMSATLLNLGTRAATELRRGEVREVIVRGELGCAVMISAGRGAVLLVLATESTPLGLIFFDMREALKAIKNIL
jgi:predicted regulator of Ras-like GTPase activity (Roadblock/LC7/MglB family)/CheY-like chemotaxis protein